MKKNIMIINADREAAQIVKDNLARPSTNVLCVSSMHEALLSFMDKEFCLVILDACISAEDDHKLLKAMRKARTTPILILSTQSCHVERLKVLQAEPMLTSATLIRWKNVLPRHRHSCSSIVTSNRKRKSATRWPLAKISLSPRLRGRYSSTVKTYNSPARSSICCSALQATPDRYSAGSSFITKCGTNTRPTMWMMW